MKHYNQKLSNYFEWLTNNDTFQIPTPTSFEIYRMENEGIEELTENEIRYLNFYQEALLFDKGVRGVFKGDVSKFALANNFGWSERAQKKEEESTDYVQWNFEGLNKEPTSNHDGESLENEAVKDLGNNK